MPKKTGSKKSSTASLQLETYIVKVGKQTDPNLTLKKDAREAINKILHCLTDHYVRAIAELLLHDQKKTASTRDVGSVTIILLKGQVAKHAKSEGTKAITKFSTFQPKKGQNRVSAAQKAGLVFSPSRVEAYLRKELLDHKIDSRVSGDTAVYLAAVLEYITAEIIQITGSQVQVDKNHNRKATAESIYNTIREDSELLSSLCSCL